MSRPLTKPQLIEFANREYQRLLAFVAQLSESQRDSEPVYPDRTTKDIVAHVYAWQLLELEWYQDGMHGKKPAIPAEGYTFKDTPALNEKLYLEYRNVSWKKLADQLHQTHQQLVAIIDAHTESELFTKKQYAWTGSSNMAVYLRSALSSHYVWASDLIRKHFTLK